MHALLLFLGLTGLFLGWNAPNHYPPWPAFHLEMFAGLGLCALALAITTMPRVSPAADATLGRLPPPTAVRVWAVAATWPLLQWAWGALDFRGDAVIGFLYAIGVASALYLGQLWAARAGREQVLATLFGTLLVAAITAGGLATAQWLRLTVPSWMAMELIDNRPFANFAQPNHFGLAMVMGAISTAALYESRTIVRRGVFLLALGFCIWGVLISQSRAAQLALALVAILWLLTRRRVPTRLGLGDLLFGVAVVALLAWAIEPAQRLLLLQQEGVRTDPEVGPRQWIWLHFWAAIVERPWAGHGFNQAVRALAEVSETVHPSRNVVFAHNVLLDFMTWFGIPLGAAAFAALLAWMGGWLRRVADASLLGQRHAVFALWLALLVQSMLEFPFAHTYFLLPAALAAGAITPVRPGADPAAAASRPMQGLMFGAAMLFALLVWEYFHMESDFRFNRFERANFGALPAHESMDTPLLLDQLGALNASARITLKAGMPDAEIEMLRRLARRFHIPSTRMDYAKALALNGRMAEARHEMVVIRSVSPPQQFESIDRHWRGWLASQGLSAESTGPTAPR